MTDEPTRGASAEDVGHGLGVTGDIDATLFALTGLDPSNVETDFPVDEWAEMARIAGWEATEGDGTLVAQLCCGGAGRRGRPCGKPLGRLVTTIVGLVVVGRQVRPHPDNEWGFDHRETVDLPPLWLTPRPDADRPVDLGVWCKDHSGGFVTGDLPRRASSLPAPKQGKPPKLYLTPESGR